MSAQLRTDWTEEVLLLIETMPILMLVVKLFPCQVKFRSFIAVCMVFAI